MRGRVVREHRDTPRSTCLLCERHGRPLDELEHDQPALAACYGASASDRQSLGAAPGQRTRKLVHPVCEVPPSEFEKGCSTPLRCASIGLPRLSGGRFVSLQLKSTPLDGRGAMLARLNR